MRYTSLDPKLTKKKTVHRTTLFFSGFSAARRREWSSYADTNGRCWDQARLCLDVSIIVRGLYTAMDGIESTGGTGD